MNEDRAPGLAERVASAPDESPVSPGFCPCACHARGSGVRHEIVRCCEEPSA